MKEERAIPRTHCKINIAKLAMKIKDGFVDNFWIDKFEFRNDFSNGTALKVSNS